MLQQKNLYDHFSPRYWVTFGLGENETHRAYLQKFLERVAPGGMILSAACGVGRYDGMLLEATHSVLSIDQSAGMLAWAKEHFPDVQYEKMALMERPEASGEQADVAVYHYYPPLETVREWIDQAGLAIEEEGAGSGFHHFVLRKRQER